MPEQSSRLAVAESILEALADANTMTRSHAALYSRSICKLWDTEFEWDNAWSKEQLDDAVRLIQAANTFKMHNELAKAGVAYKRAGEILEWLSKSSDFLNQEVPLALLGGAAFQLGGFPAMANSLLYDPASVLGNQESVIYCAFFKADFFTVTTLCTDFWANYENSEIANEGTVIRNDIIRCLGLISWALYTGEKHRVELALKKLKLIAGFAMNTMSSYTWLLLNLLEETAAQYEGSSIWTWTNKVRDTVNPQGESALVYFAGSACANNKPLVWPAQQEAIAKLAARKSFAMCTPTASGKTTIAQLAVLQGLFPREHVEDVFAQDNSAPLVLVLSPSRALSAETEQKMEQTFLHRGQRVLITGMYGGTEWSLAEVWLNQEKPTILICTVEKAEALFRCAGKHILERLTLMIVDEAHQILLESSDYNISSLVDGENRSIRLESFVSRLFALKPELRAIALSAVAFGADKTIASWISQNRDPVPVGTDYRSTRQLIGELHVFSDRSGRIVLERLNDKKLRLHNGENAFIPLKFSVMPKVAPKFRNSIYMFNEANVFWTAINLAAQKRSVLVATHTGIDTSIRNFAELLYSTHWERNTAEFFTAPTSGYKSKIYEDCLNAVADFCGKESHEYRLLTRGVAVHYGQLPSKLRQLMVKVIDLGIAPITVATSTLTEGVNLPFDIILMPRTVRTFYDATIDRKTDVSLTANEFKNLAGRAGRPGTQGEGITLVAIPQEVSSTAIRQQKTLKKQIDKMKSQYTSLMTSLDTRQRTLIPSSPLGLLLNRIIELIYALPGIETEFDIEDWLEKAAIPENKIGLTPTLQNAYSALDSLDHILLSAIAEAEQEIQEISASNLEARLKEIWSTTYSSYALSTQTSLETLFVKRGVAIQSEIYPAPEQRRKLYKLGLSPAKGRAFLKISDSVEELLRGQSDYYLLEPTAQFEFFAEILSQLIDNQGLVFGTRFQKLNQKWPLLLAWWLQVPGAMQPEAMEVRNWLGFANDNFEYRASVAIDGVIALAWEKNSVDGESIPSLQNWCEKTGLPWTAFWCGELLRWGTLNPLTAFLLSTKDCSNRAEANAKASDYQAWIKAQDVRDAEPLSPLLMKDWLSTTIDTNHLHSEGTGKRRRSFRARPLETFPTNELEAYDVLPSFVKDKIMWFDPAGYPLATSANDEMQWDKKDLVRPRGRLIPALEMVTLV